MRKLACTLTAALTVAAPTAFAAEQVEVQGVAAVVNNDIGMARDKAIDDAKRKAVEQVAGTRVSSETITENFQLVSDRIYARASGFVKAFEIKSEYKEEGTYYVKIVAQVDADAIADNLDQLFAVKPRVIVMIAEQNIGAGNYEYWWGHAGFTSEMDIMQTTLIGDWQPKGFKFIEPGMLKGRLRLKKGMKRAELANNDALMLSKSADADVAIVGKVAVTDAGPVMDGVKMRSFHAVGSLRVLNVDTGEIIAVADDTAVAAHIDGNVGGREAIKALAKKVGESLQRSIMSKWTAEAAGGLEIELVVKGGAKAKDLDAIRRFLTTEVRGVERADVRRRGKTETNVRVLLRGTAMDLGKALEGKSFEGFSLEIESTTKSQVVVEVARAS